MFYNSVMPGISHTCASCDVTDEVGVADVHDGSGMDAHKMGVLY
jgi:hypothetical protein